MQKVSAIINDTIKVSGMVTTTSDNLIVNGSLQNMNENMVIEFSNLNDKDNKVAIGVPSLLLMYQTAISREF